MTTATETRQGLIWKVTNRGTTQIFREIDGSYTVEESNLYEGIVGLSTGLKTYKAAKREYQCYH